MLPFSYIYVPHVASYFPTKSMLLGYRFKFSESYEVSTKNIEDCLAPDFDLIFSLRQLRLIGPVTLVPNGFPQY